MSQLDIAAIGKRISFYRRRNRWSAQHLADNTDGAVSRATIANIEAGRRSSIGIEQFLMISLALRVPPVALLVDLDRPLDVSELGFPGAAPAPLEPGAPTIALVRWLNADSGSATTEAGRYVATVLELLTRYLLVVDIDEATAARARLASAPPSQRAAAVIDRSALRQQLLAHGLRLPPG